MVAELRFAGQLIPKEHCDFLILVLGGGKFHSPRRRSTRDEHVEHGVLSALEFRAPKDEAAN